MPKEKITGYQNRKRAGLCVRPGCEIKPKKGPDGKPRSYCPVHNAQNAKNSKKRQKAKAAKKPKLVRRRKVAVVPRAGWELKHWSSPRTRTATSGINMKGSSFTTSAGLPSGTS